MPRAHRDLICDTLVLEPGSREPLQDQIVVYFRNAIRTGRLRRGRALPSSRRLAELQGISRTTVMEAYQRLRAEGYLTPRSRAGFFVAEVLPEEFSQATPAAPPVIRRDRATGNAAAPASQGLMPGVPALDLFPWRVWNRISASLLRCRDARLIGPGDPRGELPLREAVAEYLGTLRGITCTPEQLIIGNGSQPLVEIVLRALARPGDDVWFEEPGDPASRAVLTAAGLRIVPVPVDHDGLDVAEGCRRAPAARLALVAPSHHYPLGVTLSLERRRALLEWANRAGAWIIENEIDGDYRFVRRSREPLYAMDQARRVIYLGSFNKALAPGLRVGYLVVPAELASELAACSMQLRAPLVSVQQQLLLARFWSAGHLAAHLRQLREAHARRRALLLEALRAEADGLLRLDGPPEAGLRIPLILEPTAADERVVDACLSQNLHVGSRAISRCYYTTPRCGGLYIGFASTPEAQILPAVRRLAQITRAELSAGG